MTYKLPFNLKQKPVRKYFEGGVIKFSCREGKLFYTIKQITKTGSGDIRGGQVGSRTHLGKGRSIMSYYESATNGVSQYRCASCQGITNTLCAKGRCVNCHAGGLCHE